MARISSWPLCENRAMSNEPLAPIPDSKDWTWVLEEPCAACGFDAAEVDPTQTGTLLRANAQAWADVLDRPDDQLRSRPAPQVWSPLEYSCHVRDVYVLFGARLALMRREDGPQFENWNQDVTAIEQRYDLADPAEVRAALLDAGSALADAFENLGQQAAGVKFRQSAFACLANTARGARCVNNICVCHDLSACVRFP